MILNLITAANQGVLYHYTDLEGALGILQSGVINPTTNFQNAHKARGLKPGVSLSRHANLRLYGLTRLALDSDVIRHNHKLAPFEFEPARHGRDGALHNAEEYVQGPLKKVHAALLGIDIVQGRDFKRNDGPGFVEKFRALTDKPVIVHDPSITRAPPFRSKS